MLSELLARMTYVMESFKMLFSLTVSNTISSLTVLDRLTKTFYRGTEQNTPVLTSMSTEPGRR